MPDYCAAEGCSNSSRHVKMSTFPKDPVRRSIWIQRSRVSESKQNRRLYLCEHHFTEKSWEKVRVDGKKKLSVNAVPEVFGNQVFQIRAYLRQKELENATYSVFEETDKLNKCDTSPPGTILEIYPDESMPTNTNVTKDLPEKVSSYLEVEDNADNMKSYVKISSPIGSSWTNESMNGIICSQVKCQELQKLYAEAILQNQQLKQENHRLLRQMNRLKATFCQQS